MPSSLAIFTGVLMLITAGVFAGLYISKLSKPLWVGCVLIGLVIVFLIVASRKFPAMSLYTPFNFLTYGRHEFVILSVAIALTFSILIPKLSSKRLKVLSCIMLCIALFEFAATPFLSPAFAAGELSKLETTIIDDVCVQSTHYTCGAACTVTALRQLGIEADESKLALLSYTSRLQGTRCNLLADAVKKEYGNHGLECEYRLFKNVEELEGLCPVIVTVKFTLFVDHFVTVLDIEDNFVTIGDPLQGKIRIRKEIFKDRWRSKGLVIRKQN